MHVMKILIAAMAAATVAFLPAAVASGQLRWQPVAVSGAPAADIPGATYLDPDDFELALDDTGRVAFITTLTGTAVDLSNDSALYYGAPGSVQLVAREGQVAPGDPSQRLFGWGGVVNDSNPFDSLEASGGRLAFHAIANLPDGTYDPSGGVYTTTGGALQPVVLTGPVPGLRPGEVVRGMSGPLLVGQDLVSVGAAVGPPDSTVADQAIYRIPIGGSPELLVRTGDPTPIAGTTYGEFYGLGLSRAGFPGPSPNAIVATLVGPDVTDANNRAFFVGPPGSMLTVARSGDPAPGIPGGVFAGSSDSDVPIFLTRLSPAGTKVAFYSQLAGGSEAFFAGSAAAPQFIAKTGDTIPGVEGSVVWMYPGGVTDAGRFLAWADLKLGEEQSSQALVSNGPDGGTALVPVAAIGQQVPGQPPGVTYASYVSQANQLLSHPQLGDVFIFSAGLAGPGTIQGDSALFLGRLDADPVMLLRGGDLIEVAPGDFREPTYTWAVTEINALGQVAVLTQFTDGSEGVFLVTVPEPASASFIFFVASMMLRRRKPPQD